MVLSAWMADYRRMGGSVLLLALLALHTNAQGNVMPEISNTVETLREDIPLNGFAFQIQATDSDGDTLTFSLFGPNANYFDAVSNTGSVTVIRYLDRETFTSFPLGLRVFDGTYTAEKEIQIILSDANDNKPLFEDAPYNVNVMENTADSLLFTVSATDIDTGLAALIKYTINEVVPSEGTSLFSIGERSGKVTLLGTLDYNEKSPFYRLEIVASDSGGSLNGNTVIQSSNTFAYITVLDVPDLDPRFINPSFTATVIEHSPVGQSVFKARAIDQDAGINDKITYSIENSNAADLFQISAPDGVISIKSIIDREALLDINYVVILTVTATEAALNVDGLPAKASTEVFITITDINDHKPKFYLCDVDPCVEASSFSGQIPEHFSGSVPLSIIVKDLDQGNNARIQLTLDGPDKDAFSVTPASANSESTVQILVKNPQIVDYESKTSMVVHVIATDPSNEVDCCSTATVTIRIEDTNDNRPTFPNETYSIDVPEHSLDGTQVAIITASDPDTMDAGEITYKLLPESMLKFFDVDPKTGEIFVKNSNLIDREVNSLYSGTLQARDLANNIGTTVLEITLTDINDNPPVISRESYMGLVREGPDGQLRVQIQATDADEPETSNSDIVFKIVGKNSDLFTINPITGELTNSGPLDREAIDRDLNGKIELNVTATDKGTPPLSTWVEVIVDVEDINDNSPTFIPADVSYKFSVYEGKKGAFVGLVNAKDLDQTLDHNRISFSIIGGSVGNFIIRSLRLDEGLYSGNITVDPDIELDYESNLKSFKLIVEATDQGQKSTVTVDVNVLDINDERPEFKPTGPLSVKENTTISEVVGRFEATDRDGNHLLVYELVSMKCLCQGTLGPCEEEWFNLDPKGEITVNNEFVIDYEMCTQVEIEAQVVDEYTEKGENNSATPGHLVINIEDINDNAPEFIRSDADVFVVVSEGTDTGKSVAQVKAEDRDSGINKQIVFDVARVQFHDINNQTSPMGPLFRAVTTAQDNFYIGVIQSAQPLGSNLKGKYLVTVEATDSGDLVTTTVLEIFTVDTSFKVELLFRSPKAEVEKNLNAIILALTAATKAKVEVVGVRVPDTRQSRETSETYVDAYFVFPNGTALTDTVVEEMVSQPDHAPILAHCVSSTCVLQETTIVKKKELDTAEFALLGLVAGLTILLVVMTTSLVCTRRSYQTKMKAAKAMKSAAMVANENLMSGPVVPGTNKYTMEGANPVLNLNIDTTIDLGFDEDGSSTDRVSLNSLDIDINLSEKDMMPMMMIQEEDEEYGGEPDYIEPLGAALAQRGRKRDSDSPHLTFSNPAFSTTDL